MLVNISNLQQEYYEHYKFKPSNEFNFLLSGKNTIVAFINDRNDIYSSLISVLDLNYNPLFTYKTNAFIHACNISDDGNYIVWQTASSPNEDSDSIFLFDTYNKKLLWKIQSYIHCKYSKGIYVFPKNNIVECIFEDISIKYDMNGKEIDSESNYRNMLKSTCVSPYYWNIQAMKIINELKCDFNHLVEQEVLDRLNAAEQNSKMSKYQLSITYKELADCYYKNNFYSKALECYEKGLLYNNKLPVKRKISKLKKELNS